MNYDEMLTQEQYKHDDRPLNDDKVWCVFTDGNFIDTSSNEMGAFAIFILEKQYYETIGKGDLKEKIEYGWVYQNDFDPMNFEYTYSLLNVVETYKKE